MRVIIGKLAQISAAIKKSGSKYRNQRADATLTDQKREELEAHFRFILVIGLRDSEPRGNSLTTQELVQKVACIEELTTVQKRLIHANILRQNRVVMASPEEVPEENYDDERPRFAASRFSNRIEMVEPGTGDVLDSIQVSSIPTPGVAASLHTRTATSVGSKLDVKPILQKATPSVTTKVTQTGEMQDYPPRPKAEGDNMIQCPYCADLLLPEDLKTDRRWRGHVARDISPYSCIVDECTLPDEMYVTSNDLLQHFKAEHGVRYWVCDHCYMQSSNPTSFIFETSDEWNKHMTSLHHDTFADIQSLALSELSQRIMLPPVSCPLCGYSSPHPSTVLDEHIVQHLHSFALTSLPWGLDHNDDDGDHLSGQATEPRSTTKTNISRLSYDEADTFSHLQQGENALIQLPGDPQNLLGANLSMISHQERSTSVDDWLLVQDNILESPTDGRQSEEKPHSRLDSLELEALPDHLQQTSTTLMGGHTSGSSTLGHHFSSEYSADVSNAMEIGLQGLYGDTPSQPTPLNRLIRRALRTGKGNGSFQTFLPDDKLVEIMTVENVQHYLSNSGNIFHEHYDGIVEHVCGQGGRSNARHASRRIFATLLLMKEPRLILDFLEQGIDDGDLPLIKVQGDSSFPDSEGSMDDDEDDYLARSTSDGPIMIKKFCEWTYAQRLTFYNNQWRVQVPILLKGRRTPELHPVHKFDKDIILPWIEYEEHYRGNSDVSRVKIHKAHAQLSVGDDQSFALKSLRPIIPQYAEQEFRLEVTALLKVKERPHLEVSLLTSFEYREQFHLLSRWADGGNLRNLWEEQPRPDLNHSRICWMAQQFYGLAHGLDGIHNTKMTASEVEAAQTSPLSPDLVQEPFESARFRVPEDDEGKDYGRHGDIKPENVLWFKQDPSHSEFGILKLSDFGLTTFHRALTTGVKVEDIKVTNTYSAPEREIDETLSQSFDVWSLGCLFLEFVTWILLGSKKITKFADERLLDGGDRSPRFSLDNFFTVFRHKDEAKYRARVKPSVSRWIIGLKKRSERSQYLSELLDYIEKRMLLVQKDERDVSKTISDQLKGMLEKCKQDEGYAVRRGAKDSQQGKSATRSRSVEQNMGESDNRSKRVKLSVSHTDRNNDQGPANRTRSRSRLGALQQTGDDTLGN